MKQAAYALRLLLSFVFLMSSIAHAFDGSLPGKAPASSGEASVLKSSVPGQIPISEDDSGAENELASDSCDTDGELESLVLTEDGTFKPFHYFSKHAFSLYSSISNPHYLPELEPPSAI